MLVVERLQWSSIGSSALGGLSPARPTTSFVPGFMIIIRGLSDNVTNVRNDMNTINTFFGYT
jgi:hypothetical protein